ncbi:hypothetical protein ACFLVO_03695 [Chloroflexota bacterium]
MSKQITLEDDVVFELMSRGLELDMAFSSASEILRVILGMSTKTTDTNANYPSSHVSVVQKLLDGLRDTIFSVSKNGMRLYGINKRWVATPNIVTITVQDARAHNLRVTVYGRPSEFEDIKSSLDIKNDMAGYSRFVINSENELPSAIKVIQHSYELKKKRGRLSVY